MTDGVFKAMTILYLRTQLGDLFDIAKGRPSLFYGGFFCEHGRYPTKEEIQLEMDRIKKELTEIDASYV